MAAGELKISDGVETINFHPGATAKRTLDKTDGLFVKNTGRNSTPIARSFKRSRDLIVVNTDFASRFSDYQALFSMVKEETNASTFTLTWGTESFTVVVRRLMMSQDAGAGDIRPIECEMEIVRSV